MRGPWEFEKPLCAEVGGDFWFPEQGDSSMELRIARSICNRCIHQQECIEWAVENENFGIWGGTNERARRVLRRKGKVA